MNFINSFELMCYIIVGIMLFDLYQKKDKFSLYVFGSAAIVGYVMELAAVSVTDIYYYNPNFWISIGIEPYQFPFFGGLMWGGLTVYAIQLAKKLNFNAVNTALTAGMLIVSMDLLLDVVAIRLDQGFWTWVGNPINLEITQHTFMSVIWVNFLGYMIETPTVVYLYLKNKKLGIASMIKIAIQAILVTSAGSLVALLLNYFTDDWFSCIAFLAVYLSCIILITKQTFKTKLTLTLKDHFPSLLFWTAMYGYCFIGILYLEIEKTHLWFLVLGILLYVYTAYLSLAKRKL